MNPPREYKSILTGIVGSRAYGLAHADSDIDYRGVFVTPTEDILSLFPPHDTIVTKDPDVASYELHKFLRLITAANPNVLELLWLDEYEILTWEGQALVDIRECFLSKRIYETYGGYAMSQAMRLLRRGGDFGSDLKKRYSKHARHCFRLLLQGKELLETGHLNVRLADPESIRAVGELPPEELVALFQKTYEDFMNTQTSLPEMPDIVKINKVLIEIRRNN